MAKVKIPFLLQMESDNLSEIEIKADSIEELVKEVNRRFSKLKGNLFDSQGNLNKFVNFYLNDKDVRFLKGENSSLKETDVVSIILPIAGG